MYDMLTEIKQIKTIIENGLVERNIENVNVTYDLDNTFNLTDINNNSTPIIVIEIEEIMSTKSGAKGQMIAGIMEFKLLFIVGKTERTFDNYYKELTNLIEIVREIFDYYPTKSYQFISHKLINNYDIAGYPAVANISTYHVLLKTNDYS